MRNGGKLSLTMRRQFFKKAIYSCPNDNAGVDTLLNTSRPSVRNNATD
jgi:hypothetical protein